MVPVSEVKFPADRLRSAATEGGQLQAGVSGLWSGGRVAPAASALLKMGQKSNLG